MISISVVVCAYTEDRWAELLAAIESVKAQSFPAHETIVVVDRNPQLLERVHRLPGVIAVPNVDTPGLGGARNSGFEASTGTVVAFLDDDAVASEDWLRHFRDAYESSDDVLGVGGAIDPIWPRSRPNWFPLEFGWVVGCTYTGMPQEASAVRNLIGCNMSYRRDVIAELDGFRLGYGCDETDFCIRAHRRWPNGDLRYVPEARVSHVVTEDRTTWRHFRTRCYFEGGSKAVVSWLEGATQGLESERSYVLRTLPRGFVRGIRDAARGDSAGLARAGAIIAGLAFTTGGFVTGKFNLREAAKRRGWSGMNEKVGFATQ